MKRNLLLVALITSMSVSCAVQKRHYLSGYHIQGHNRSVHLAKAAPKPVNQVESSQAAQANPPPFIDESSAVELESPRQLTVKSLKKPLKNHDVALPIQSPHVDLYGHEEANEPGIISIAKQKKSMRYREVFSEGTCFLGILLIILMLGLFLSSITLIVAEAMLNGVLLALLSVAGIIIGMKLCKPRYSDRRSRGRL